MDEMTKMLIDGLSQTEVIAMANLAHEGGCISQSMIPARNEKDLNGWTVPSIAVYRRLEKKGLCVVCTPIVDGDGFEWTPDVEFTDLGRNTFRAMS